MIRRRRRTATVRVRVLTFALLLLVAALVAAGCGDDSDSAAESTAGAAATTPAGEIDGRFEVGGYQLHLACQGGGSAGVPTIVYVHGLGGDGSDVNEALAGRLVDRARVCTYDRLNVGRSDVAEGRHSGAESVSDLRALLATADVPGPYVMVGFSFGGLLASMYAAAYPDEVAGVLMLDASLPTDDEVDALIPAGMRRQVIAEQEANPERVDFYRTLEQAEAALASVPDVPLTYMAAVPVELPPEWPVARMRALIRAKQVAFVERFPQGRLLTVRSSHDIDLERPGRVVAEIDRLLAGS